MKINIFQHACVLRRSVSTLLDVPLNEKESSANYYLTTHCLMLSIFLLGLINKYFFDFIDVMVEIWPVKSQNFRNPLSLGSVMALILGVPTFLFWRHLGKICFCHEDIQVRRNYWVITVFSTAINLPLLFVAAKLNLPEISLTLSALNFFLWAKWSIHEYVKQGGQLAASKAPVE